MGLSHDIRRATARKRRLQAKRNAAQAEANRHAQQRLDERDPRARKMDTMRPPTNKMLPGPPSNKLEPEPEPESEAEGRTSFRTAGRVGYQPEDRGDWLCGVPFASSRAYQLASSYELSAQDFAGREPGGRGGFTTEDVREVAGR